MTETKSPRIIVVQPVIPSYRNSFFNSIFEALDDRFSVYASNVDMGALTSDRKIKPWQRTLGPIKKLAFGLYWQCGALSIPIMQQDIVVISGAPRCLSNILLLIKARLLGAKSIWWGQLWSSTTKKHRFILRLFLMRLSHALLFYTDDEIKSYITNYGINDKRPIFALNNGIDINPIKKLRNFYSAKGRGNSILFLGRLTEKAQIQLLLNAMLHDSLSTATLHVIGDGPILNSLKAFTFDNGLQDRIKWYGATVNERQIADIANCSAVFCYPGGVGLSLIHAMAYGLPAVIHNNHSKHMPEIAAFEKNVTGFSFEYDSAASLSQTLASALKNHSALDRMSQESLHRSDTVYNTDEMSKRFLQAIMNLELKNFS